ncbi:hypothetical protein ACB478_005092 [Klebsiella quasipneumoniae]|uniref:hypothetical protein n=1 Tax=Klebsiella quasipneumoniae TaxID=1463165 RepID=UPI0015AECE52|nr:hypothetical protein [Klebsiella quasipneumoniae]
MKPGKEGHLTVAFRFFSATSITLPPSPASDWRRLSWFFPLWVLKIAFRSGFIQVAKKQQKQ